MPPSLARFRTAALPAAALLALAAPAAASCTAGTDAAGNPTLTCDGAVTARQNLGQENLTVTITPGSSIAVANNRPLNLTGANQTVINRGLLQGGGGNDGIRTSASGLTVDNEGSILATDRGIRLTGASSSFTLFNRETGVIEAVNQAVRLDQAVLPENNLIENRGRIESIAGRAIQSRGTGTTVINHATGVLIGGEEVIEGRLGFTLENRGFIGVRGIGFDRDTLAWTDNGARVDQDGVQFSSGRVDNFGVILATDDGIDIDEGVVHNHRGGVIISIAPAGERDRAAVDIDDLLQIPLPGDRERFEAPGKVTIVNEGHMEGPRAINAAGPATQPVEIVNSGALIGRSGTAIELAPGQGDSTIALFDLSVVEGDILFGAGGLNTLILGPFETGARFDGQVRVHDGGGFEVAFGPGFALGDFTGLLFGADRFALGLRAGADRLRFDLFGASAFAFDGARFAPEEFAAFLRANGVSAIPLPAAGWLLLGGLGLLAGLARRRRPGMA